MYNDPSGTLWPPHIRYLFTHSLQKLAIDRVGDVRSYMVLQASKCGDQGDPVSAGVWLAMVKFLDDEHIRVAIESRESIHGSLVEANDPFNNDDKRSAARAALASKYDQAEERARRMIEKALGVSEQSIQYQPGCCDQGLDGAAHDFAYSASQWEEGKLKTHRAFNIVVTAECKRAIKHPDGFHAELWACAYGLEMRDEIFDSRMFAETATTLAGTLTLKAIADGLVTIVGGML